MMTMRLQRSGNSAARARFACRPAQKPCGSMRYRMRVCRMPSGRAHADGVPCSANVPRLSGSSFISLRKAPHRHTQHRNVRRLLASRQVVGAKAAMQMRGIKRRRPGCYQHPSRLTKFVHHLSRNRTKMATKTRARPRTPVASAETAQDPADLLESTLSQLEALLWVCHGEDIDWCAGDGPRRLDNLLWLAADLARKAGELFQLNAKARRAD